MGVIVNAFYNAFPIFGELEKKIEETITYVEEKANEIKSLKEYAINNKEKIIEDIGNRFRAYATGVITDILRDAKKSCDASKAAPAPQKPAAQTQPKAESYKAGRQENNPAYKAKPTYKAKPAAAPASQAKTTTKAPANASTRQAPAKTKAAKATVLVPSSKASSSSLDGLVNDFRRKLKSFNCGYEANIDVYDNGSVIRSYASVAPKPKAVAHEKPRIMKQASAKGNKYLEDSLRIANYYNQGYRTEWIIKEAAFEGIEGVMNRTDITDRVALIIDSGFAYRREVYDGMIAAKLGAKEQLVNDYLAGKSYKEIRENLKRNTNGMVISDSSILRTMHKYEKEAKKKVVGKRNGKGQTSRKKSLTQHHLKRNNERILCLTTIKE